MLSQHKVSTAVCDNIDDRHRDLLPDYVWGDGDPAGVQERAAEEMIGDGAGRAETRRLGSQRLRRLANLVVCDGLSVAE